MAKLYELLTTTNADGEKIPDCIRRLSDGACIPITELNRDYREYKRLVSEGKTTDLGV